MKYIVLAAGRGIDSFLIKSHLPKCLSKMDNKTVIDNILEVSESMGIHDINVVGGFEILKIMKAYPSLKYYYNEKWESTKSLFSFSKAFATLDDNSFVSYADIIHKSETLKRINRKKINIFYDSEWKTRYASRDTLNLEKIFDNQTNLLGEFSGLIYIPKNEVAYIKDVAYELLNKNKNEILLSLINRAISEKNINFIDVKGNWAELDSIQDIENFKFGTKAETLNILKKQITLSNILEQYTFTVDEYKKNIKHIINDIQIKLDSERLIVRSSALNEDTHYSSMAGNYETILKVQKSKYKSLQSAIELVIESYTKNGQLQNIKNQILIQPYLENVTMSGVAFSKDLQTASPYYIVNYDESSDTESVTSGNGDNLNTFICYNDFDIKIEKKELQLLIDAVKEIESITKFDAIDVEFAFVNENLYILQVRPIAANKNTIKVSSYDISNEIENIKLFIKKSTINLLGTKKAYGVMPDWNPAEIIGINPKPLSFDLYRYLITDTVWAKSRKELGYRDVKNNMGLVSFAGKPYVDIKMSFNSFIPNYLDKNITTKLVDYFIEKLKKNPHNHDKIEFNIAITSFDFNFNDKLKKLSLYSFSNNELKKIEKSYKELTESIILEENISIKNEIDKTLSLTQKRETILRANISDIDKIYNLLEDCKQYGTLSFANLARLGFIGSIFLKSLLHKNIINQDEYDNFFKSIHTVAKNFKDDFNLLLSEKLLKNKFLELYGHLRPGTYDITSKSYNEGFDDYIDIDYKAHSIEKETNKFEFSVNTKSRISEEIKKHDLNFTMEELIDFIIRATEAREKSKFEFTKSLSTVLELVSKVGSCYNLSKDDLSYLNLDIILKYKNTSSRIDFENSIRENILNNKKKFLITSAIRLPELIFETKDVEMFHYPSLKPNFISQQKIEANTVVLEGNRYLDIDNKIVLIESADPGYDWIFSHDIKGLVTKYGGSASHMAIRCAEFDLPAAIGCGDTIFDDLLQYKSITLDCINYVIKGIE